MKFIPIKNFSKYVISASGVIRSIDRYYHKISKNGKAFVQFKKGQIIKYCKQTKGYLSCTLYDDNLIKITPLVHRLVAQHFLPKHNKHCEIIFKDNNKMNIKASNLKVSEFKQNRT